MIGSAWRISNATSEAAPVEMRFIDMFMAALGALIFMAMLFVFFLPRTSPIPLHLITKSLPAARAGIAYELALAYRGGVGPVSWSTAGHWPDWLTLSPEGILSGTPNGVRPTLNVQVIAVDAAGDSTTSTYQLAVEGIPLPTLPLRIATDSLPPAKSGVPYNLALAYRGGSGTVTWTKKGNWPSWLSLSSDGIISANPPSSPALPNSVEIEVVAVDAGVTVLKKYSLSIEYTVPPVGSKFLILADEWPSGRIGQYYNLTFAYRKDQVTWEAKDSASLPPGMVIDPIQGRLYGKPEKAGQFEFDIVAKYGSASREQQHYRFVVEATPPPPRPLQILTKKLPVAKLGEPYEVVIARQGGTGSVSWNSTSQLPQGLQFNDGVLSGTPKTAGTSTFGVSARDETNVAAAATVTVVVESLVPPETMRPLQIATRSLPWARAGSSYEVALAYRGGKSPVSWEASALPTGLDLDKTEGVLRGKPATTGTATLSIRAKDSAGVAVATTLPLSIEPAAPTRPTGIFGSWLGYLVLALAALIILHQGRQGYYTGRLRALLERALATGMPRITLPSADGSQETTFELPESIAGVKKAQQTSLLTALLGGGLLIGFGLWWLN